MLKLGALRQVKHEFSTQAFVDNLNLLAGSNLDRVAHPDTLGYLMKRLSPKQISTLRIKMINRMLRMRCLEEDRLLGRYYVIAIDMTGHISFGNNRHCKKCITKKKGNKTFYYHPVLEAKLISPRGMALSIETEFVENEQGCAIQDCELRAFYRLAVRLKKIFPQLKICLSLDALYANQQVFEICRKNNWKYVITFKKGSMPATYTEAMTIKSLQKENRGRYEENGLRQDYAWGTDIEHENHKTNVLECIEFKRNRIKGKRYLWLSNLEITQENFKEIANNAGRLRWKIENEGFNMQKNGGYGLEHIYSSNATAMKNFYHLLQIAHIISQLMEKGSLLKDCIKKLFGGIRNFTRRLLESLRTKHVSPEEFRGFFSTAFQIRLDSP
ncbi:MAG: hypothetical protein ABH843_04520 [Candidatus Omnitrophota bacterium]